MNKHFWLVSSLVLLSSTKVKGDNDDCNYVSIIFPVATDSCVTMVNSTGSFSTMATCTDNGDITFSYWSNGDCSGNAIRTEEYQKDQANSNLTWYCDSDNSGSDCDRTRYRYYSEEGCSTSTEYYSEFYIVNNVCSSWSLSDEGQSSLFTCENNMMKAQVYQGNDCSGDPVQTDNFTTGCSNNHKLTITCIPATTGGDNDDDESNAMAAFGSIAVLLVSSLFAVFMST